MSFRNRTEEELIEAARIGCRDSFGELSERYRERLGRYIEMSSCGKADSEAVVQETFIRAYQALGKYRGDAGFSTWLFTVAVNEMRRSFRHARPLPSQYAIPSSAEEPEEIVIRNEKIRVVQAALKCLPKLQREAIVLCRYGGLNCLETARVLGTSHGSVRTAVYNGLKELRKTLIEGENNEL